MLCIELKGADRVIEKLQKLLPSGDLKPRVVVGYTADYAVTVHEDTQAVHPNGQAKFLEAPEREGRAEAARRVKEDLKAGATLSEALLTAGQDLLARSQPLAPVHTGFLRDSGFVELTEGGGI